MVSLSNHEWLPFDKLRANGFCSLSDLKSQSETFEFLLKFGKSSYRRVTPVKTGAVSSTLLVPGFRRDDIWIPVPVPDPGSVPAPDLIRGPGQAPIRLSPE